MKKFFQCCFPTKKEEVPLNDKTAEIREENIDDSRLKQPELDLTKAQIDHSIQNNIEEEKKEDNSLIFKSSFRSNEQKNESNNQKENNSENKKNDNNNQEENKENNNNDDKKKENNENNNDKKENDNEKDITFEIIGSNRKITNEEILNSQIIIIKDEEGNLLNGKEIKINAGGMEGGRGKNDGVTIFGINNNNNKFKPDFYLNYDDKLSYPYIFSVYYENESKNYSIRAFSGKNSNNRLLYIKLNENYSLPLRQQEIISAGNIVFQINLLTNNKIEIINLSMPDSSIENKKIFDPNNIKIITIGRDKNSTFSFPKDKSISRNQTSFYFDDEKKEWTIIDGNKNKSSTNGTWVFGTHSFIIKNHMIIEILNSKLKFLIKENEN